MCPRINPSGNCATQFQKECQHQNPNNATKSGNYAFSAGDGGKCKRKKVAAADIVNENGRLMTGTMNEIYGKYS